MFKQFLMMLVVVFSTFSCSSGDDGGGGGGGETKSFNCGINQAANPCAVLDGEWVGSFFNEDEGSKVLSLMITSDATVTRFSDVIIDDAPDNSSGTFSDSAVNSSGGFVWADDDGGSGHALPDSEKLHMLWYNEENEIGILQKGADDVADSYAKSELVGTWAGIHWDLQGDSRPALERDIEFTVDNGFNYSGSADSQTILDSEFTFSGNFNGDTSRLGYTPHSYRDDRGRTSGGGALLSPDKSAMVGYECSDGQNCSVWMVKKVIE